MTGWFHNMAGYASMIPLLVLCGCSESSTQPAIQEPPSDQVEFSASVSGHVNGEVSGAGIVTYLPPKARDPVTGIRPGYYLIANLQSERTENTEFTIIFRIPDKAQPGNYELVTPDPLKVGENFDVQVETVKEGQSIIYQRNTEGIITLESLSPDRTDPKIRNFTGTFTFVAENSEGKQISATGTFDVDLVGQYAFQGSTYS